MAEVPKWKRFEHLIHQIHQQYDISGARITLDDHIPGQDSKTLRQVDISIRVQIGPYSVLIAVECKDHAHPLDVGAIGEFVALRNDIRANKGVVVSTGGFTPAAIELARSLGIDTRTYIDTESQDWGTDVAIPIVLDMTKLLGYSFTFSTVRSNPPLPLAMRTDVPAHLIEIRTPEGLDLGPLILLLGRRWNHDESLHIPGEHTITLTEHALLGNMGHAYIEATLLVERRFYSGPLGVHLAGFRNEQDGSLQTKELRTNTIDPRQIVQGLVEGWRELKEYRNYKLSTGNESDGDMLMIDGVPLKAMMVMGCVHALPETREDLASDET